MTTDQQLITILRKLDNKKKNEFKPGDIVKAMKSNTTGVVTKVKEDQVIFRTFDRPEGWCEHQSKIEVLEKFTLAKRKPNTANKFYKFVKKANQKLYVTKQDFTITDGNTEKTLRKGEGVFIDEMPIFTEATQIADPDGYTPSQLHIALGTETCLTLVRCFAPQIDKYVFLPIKKLKPFQWNKTLIDKVTFPEKTRLLRYLTTNLQQKDYGINFHKGKGKVILLYGEVGSGKTFTCESISHHLQKPLIRVDIEERNSLQTIKNAITQAELYDGILFIDEADMFLADRHSNQARVEAIQVLLKYLETFSGIVFLSTNFGSQLDPAIENRIDMKIHYHITESTRENIWKKNMPAKTTGKFNYNKYKKVNLNGRDIQKVITFAAQKAKNENKKQIPVKYIEQEADLRLKEKQDYREVKYGTANKDYFG